MTHPNSIKAYYDMAEEGLLSKRRLEVYEALMQHGPCTANELNRVMPSRGINHANITTRLGELRDLGVVDELESRECNVTKRMVTVWECNGNLPTGKLEKKTTNSIKIERFRKLLNKVYVHAPETVKHMILEEGKRYGLLRSNYETNQTHSC